MSGVKMANEIKLLRDLLGRASVSMRALAEGNPVVPSEADWPLLQEIRDAIGELPQRNPVVIQPTEKTP